ncbi:MAG: class I SAM-dependent methyltransferase [Chromatiaceae bacterium]|nr:class I SAM-dependent methyltransferase [Chromatiaceae bacterium]
MKEPILEPLLRRMRLRQVLPYIEKHQDCRLLDIGCGWDIRLLRSIETHITTGIGIDFKVPDFRSGKIRTMSARLDKILPFDDASFDLITMLAVLEHLDNPVEILCECKRILRPGGGLLLTVPSRRAKPILEFLAFKMNVVNPEEILDHKRYFNREDLIRLFLRIPGLILREHAYFQLQLNNRIFAVREG